MCTTLRVKNSCETRSLWRGAQFCEFYLQELNQIYMRKMWEKSPPSLAQGREMEPFWNAPEHSVLNKDCLQEKLYTHTHIKIYLFIYFRGGRQRERERISNRVSSEHGDWHRAPPWHRDHDLSWTQESGIQLTKSPGHFQEKLFYWSLICWVWLF